MPHKNKFDMYVAQKRHRLKIRALMFEYLSDKSCIDCGEKDPVVLEFDHREKDKKFKHISKLMSGHYSWNSVLNEIDKCDIRCANCHRRKTYIQFGFFGRSKPNIEQNILKSP
jgi:hypothetical protein